MRTMEWPKGASALDEGLGAGRGTRRGGDAADSNEIALSVDRHPLHIADDGLRTRDGLLVRFSEHVEARWYKYWDNFEELAAGQIGLKEFIDSNTQRASTIHFNLDGFKYRDFIRWEREGHDVSFEWAVAPSRPRGVTNYEFRSIINDPELRAKTIFYDRGGKAVPWRQVRRRLRNRGYGFE